MTNTLLFHGRELLSVLFGNSLVVQEARIAQEESADLMLVKSSISN